MIGPPRNATRAGQLFLEDNQAVTQSECYLPQVIPFSLLSIQTRSHG
jgi:hypothetical protein